MPTPREHTVRFDPPNRQLLSKGYGVCIDSNTCRGRHLTEERRWSKAPTVRCSRCIKSRQLLTVLSPISSSPENTSCPPAPLTVRDQSPIERPAQDKPRLCTRLGPCWVNKTDFLFRPSARRRPGHRMFTIVPKRNNASEKKSYSK